MADHLARVHGTEEDRVNCPFYFKIGACRHGDRCTRKHNRPTFSQTILLKRMYQNPKVNPMPGDPVENNKRIQKEFDEFYEDIFDELSSSYGPIEELHVCDNINEHMLGNVYVKFEDEEDAEKAIKGLSGRFYNNRPIAVEYSPVTDFREARCRQHEDGQCTRGGYCNFMHLMTPSQEVFYRCFPKGRWGYTRDERFRDMGPRGDGRRNPAPRVERPHDSSSSSSSDYSDYSYSDYSYSDYSRSPSRSPSRSRSRSRSHNRSRSRSKDRRRERSRSSRRDQRRDRYSRHSSSRDRKDRRERKEQKEEKERSHHRERSLSPEDK